MEISVATPIYRSFLERVLTISKASLDKLWRSQKKRRSLMVKETASLGERRFVAVLQFERQRFLIGGSPSSITLLACLPEEDETGERE